MTYACDILALSWHIVRAPCMYLWLSPSQRMGGEPCLGRGLVSTGSSSIPLCRRGNRGSCIQTRGGARILPLPSPLYLLLPSRMSRKPVSPQYFPCRKSSAGCRTNATFCPGTSRRCCEKVRTHTGMSWELLLSDHWDEDWRTTWSQQDF